MKSWSNPRPSTSSAALPPDVFPPQDANIAGLGLRNWISEDRRGSAMEGSGKGKGREIQQLQPHDQPTASQRASPLPSGAWTPAFSSRVSSSFSLPVSPAPEPLALPKIATDPRRSPVADLDMGLFSPLSAGPSPTSVRTWRRAPGNTIGAHPDRTPFSTTLEIPALEPSDRDGSFSPRSSSPSPSPLGSRNHSPAISSYDVDGLESAASSRSSSASSYADRTSAHAYDPVGLGLSALRSLAGDHDATPRVTRGIDNRLFSISPAARFFSPGAVLSRRSHRSRGSDSVTSSPVRIKRSPFAISPTKLISSSPTLRTRSSGAKLSLVAEDARIRSKSRTLLFREHERSRLARQRICGLTAVGILLVLGSLLLLLGFLGPLLASDAAVSSTIPRTSDRKALKGSGTTKLFPQRDSLVLYRIIGNDLPPRHSPGQTLTNLRFLLEHESSFDSLPSLSLLASSLTTKRHYHKRVWGSIRTGLKVEKFFVLNRLANATQISSVRSLLREHDVDDEHILEIPFEWEAYKRISSTWGREVGWGDGMEAVWGIGRTAPGIASKGMDDLPREVSVAALAGTGSVEQDVLSSNEAWTARKEAMARLRALDFTYHEKNLYAMNNNGGRNFALDHGRNLPNARWILPLDGNCFFTPSAMFSLAETLASSETSSPAPRHVVIPMARTLGNDQALINNTIVPDTATEASRMAPLAPDEPQVGFRWDSTENYSEHMRYGRRSKLELLWRLGAIGKGRDLGKRSHPWEKIDRKLLSQASHASILTPVEGDASLPGFLEAGWVLRLFSGDTSQEEHSPAAMTRRSVNRIKGIVSFLEVLDEGVARAIDECDEEDRCGFDAWRLWSFDGAIVEQLQQGFATREPEAVARVERFLVEAERRLKRLRPRLEKGGWSIKNEKDAEWAASTAAVLALANVLAGKREYRSAATQLIYARFLRPVDNEARYIVDTRELDAGQGDGIGYAHPIPRHTLTPSWLKLSRTALPFDPLTFDPTLLLDAIRLLSDDWHPTGDHSSSDVESSSSPVLPFAELDDLFTAQLSFLLLHPAAQRASAHPRSAGAGAAYDLRVAALAAFANDAQVLGRIANRSRLRLATGDDVANKLHAKLLAGFRNVKLRPFDELMGIQSWASEEQEALAVEALAAIDDAPFRDLLGPSA